MKVKKFAMLKIPEFPVKLPGSFWGITSLFSPAKSGLIYENYRRFRDKSKSQGLKLLALEAAFDEEPFVLIKGRDADILIQIRACADKNLIWQRERLFNLGLKSLPGDCDKVCWVDCDILFRNDLWIEEAASLLERYVAIQPFEYAVRLSASGIEPGDHASAGTRSGSEAQQIPGYAYNLIRGVKGVCSTGFAWAMRRKFVSGILLYEHMPLGSSDSFMARAWAGDKTGNMPVSLFATALMKADADRYACLAYKEIKGSIYCASGVVSHLWHGSEAVKMKSFRHKILQRYDFSPDEDIRVGSAGLLEWSSDKPELHRAVAEYFRMRNQGCGDSLLLPLILEELDSVGRELKSVHSRLKAMEGTFTQKFRRIFNRRRFL